MTVQTIVITADVPENQTTAAEAAAAAAVHNLAADVTGLVVISATYGGTSLLPSPAEVFAAALADLRALAESDTKPTQADVAAGVAKVDAAAQAYELFLAGGLTGPADTSPPAHAAPDASRTATAGPPLTAPDLSPDGSPTAGPPQPPDPAAPPGDGSPQTATPAPAEPLPAGTAAPVA